MKIIKPIGPSRKKKIITYLHRTNIPVQNKFFNPPATTRLRKMMTFPCHNTGFDDCDEASYRMNFVTISARKYIEPFEKFFLLNFSANYSISVTLT